MGCSMGCSELIRTRIEAGVTDRTMADAVAWRTSTLGLWLKFNSDYVLSGQSLSCHRLLFFRSNALGRCHLYLWGCVAAYKELSHSLVFTFYPLFFSSLTRDHDIDTIPKFCTLSLFKL